MMDNDPKIVVGMEKVGKSRSSVSAISEAFHSLTRRLSREDEAEETEPTEDASEGEDSE